MGISDEGGVKVRHALRIAREDGLHLRSGEQRLLRSARYVMARVLSIIIFILALLPSALCMQPEITGVAPLGDADGKEGAAADSNDSRAEEKKGEPSADETPSNAPVNAEASALPTPTATSATIEQCESFSVSAVSAGGPLYQKNDPKAIAQQLRPQDIKGFLTKDCGISDASADKKGPALTEPLNSGWNPF